MTIELTERPRSPGRPSKLTPAIADALVEAVRKGAQVQTVVGAAGISRTQFREWLRVGSGQQATWADGGTVSPDLLAQLQDLVERLQQAQDECEIALVSRIEEASRTVGKSGVIEWRAALALLQNSPAYRERWHQHQEVELSGRPEADPLRQLLGQLSTEKLIELLPEDYRELLLPVQGRPQESTP